MSRLLQASVPLTLLLAACGNPNPVPHSDQLSAQEAIRAGDEALARVLPQTRHHLLDVKAELRTDPKSRRQIWHLEYDGGCGGAHILVDSRTGKATIVDIEQ